MKYDAMYFLKKFDAIPEDHWRTDLYDDKSGRLCALGHCGERLFSRTAESTALALLLGSPVAINDGFLEYEELGDTPKERIINALLLVNEGIAL